MFQAVTFTVTIDPQQIITWVIIGIIAGVLAGVLVRGRRFSLLTSLITGLVGALVGGFIFFGLLHIQPSEALQKGITLRWIDMIVAFLGSVLVLLIVGLFYGFRHR